jgi:hypothetical protein
VLPPVQDDLGGLQDGAQRAGRQLQQAWESAFGPDDRPAGTPVAPPVAPPVTAPPTGATGTSTAGAGVHGPAGLRLGGGTPEQARAANQYNWDTFRVRTNFVGDKQPPVSPAPGSSGSGGSGSGVVEQAPQRVEPARQAAEPVVRPPQEAARPVVQQVQQRVEQARAAAEPVVQHAQQVQQQVQEVVQDAAESVDRAVRPVTRAVQERFEQARDAVGGLLNRLTGGGG